ncbi:hypothetical protein [uncultured Sneathia sp.]|uniref:hypothetical protein n=1 Tax=uncultured Sneathia sp. TaxID=278067 RepID=UPI0025985102|nr:hypothetical protein [uncultured Sneathia sp.]
MKILITEKEKQIIRKYMENADNYIDKEVSWDEYVKFQFELDDVIISLFDRNQNSTKESALVQTVYDDIYYRNKK